MVWVVLLVTVSGFCALNNWRNGLLACIAVGFFQDPLRKLIPGQPGLLVVTVAVVFALVYLSALLKRVPLKLAYLHGRDLDLKAAWIAFIGVVVFQCGVSLVRFGNPLVPVLGLATYFSPLAAMLIGFAYGRTEKDIRKFLVVYLFFAIPFALSVYLSYWFNNQWAVLKDVGDFSGKRLMIYDVGTVLYSYSGFLRVGEIAAWHAATACIILIVFMTLQHSMAKRLVAALVIALLIGAIVLTGRRKMLMALTVFLGVYAFILTYYWHGAKKIAVSIIILAAGLSGMLLFQEDAAQSRHSLYMMRSLTVYEGVAERLDMALKLFQSAIDRAGYIGFGAGVSAQGAQYFGVNNSVVGGSTEAGIGKIVAELGIHGLLVTSWLLWRIITYIRRTMRRTPKRYFSLTVLMAALVGFIVANAATFFVATQLYGDLFILLLLGLMAGFLFSVGNINKFYAWYEKQHHAEPISMH